MEQELSSIVASVRSQFRLGESEAQTSARFSRLCEQPGVHQLFLHVLRSQQAGSLDSDLVFFVGIGLHRLVWNQWQYFGPEEQSSLAGQVVQLIGERAVELQPHAQAKLELVLASICANAGDFSPVTGLLLAALDTADERSIRQACVGLSCLKTALDEALKPDEPRLLEEQRLQASRAASALVLPATTHACTSLSQALQALTSAPAPAPAPGPGPGLGAASGTTAALARLTHVCLGLLRVIVSRVPVGPHLSLDVLNLLFDAAALGANPPASSSGSASGSGSSSGSGSGSGFGSGAGADWELVATGAVEVLNEFMSKRYLPPAAPSASGAGAGSGAGTGSDAAADVLLHLVTRALALMQSYRGRPDLLASSAVTLPLLELLVAFAENHLPRCLASHPQALTAFVVELSVLACATTSAEILLRLLAAWGAVLGMGMGGGDEVRFFVLFGAPAEQACLPLAAHLLPCCLLRRSAELAESWGEEMGQEASLEAFADPAVRETVAQCLVLAEAGGAGGSASGSAAGAGAGGGDGDGSGAEAGCPGTSLRLAALRLLSDLAQAPPVAAFLSQAVPALVQESLTALQSSPSFSLPSSCSSSSFSSSSSSSSAAAAAAAAALDLAWLLRLLPLTTPPAALFPQLVALLLSLAEARLWGRGREAAAVLVAGFQICGQLLLRLAALPGSGSGSGGDAGAGAGFGAGAGAGEGVGLVSAALPSLVRIATLLCSASADAAAAAAAAATGTNINNTNNTNNNTNTSTSSTSSSSPLGACCCAALACLLQALGVARDTLHPLVLLLEGQGQGQSQGMGMGMGIGMGMGMGMGGSNNSNNNSNNSNNSASSEQLRQLVVAPLLQWLDRPDCGQALSPEAQALLVCCCDQLRATAVAAGYASSCAQIAASAASAAGAGFGAGFGGGQMQTAMAMTMTMATPASSSSSSSPQPPDQAAVAAAAQRLRDPVLAAFLLRLVSSLDALVRRHGPAKSLYRQQLVAALGPLRAALPVLVQASFAAVANAAAQAGPGPGPGPGSGLLVSCNLALLGLATSLLRCLGRVSFGATADAVVGVVEWATAGSSGLTSSSFPSSSFPSSSSSSYPAQSQPAASASSAVALLSAAAAAGIPGQGSAAALLAQAPTLALIASAKQALALLQATAETTSSQASQLPAQASAALRISRALMPALGASERVCDELLLAFVRAGVGLVFCYWTATGASRGAISAACSAAGSGEPAARGQAALPCVEGLVALLVELVTGTLARGSAPGDVAAAVDGVAALGGSGAGSGSGSGFGFGAGAGFGGGAGGFGGVGLGAAGEASAAAALFGRPFFLRSCWIPLVSCVCRCLLHRAHPSQRESLDALLLTLLAAPKPLAIVEANNATASSGSGSGSGSGSDGGGAQALAGGVGVWVCQLLLSLAAEAGPGPARAMPGLLAGAGLGAGMGMGMGGGMGGGEGEGLGLRVVAVLQRAAAEVAKTATD